MTGTDGDPDENTSGTDGGTRSERSSGDASGSRFGEFLDRLEEREAERKRSEAESDSDAADSTSGVDSSEPPGGSAETEPETDPDGWMWGSPKGNSEGDPDGDAASESDGLSDRAERIEPEEAPAGGSDSDTDRLWNTDIDPIDGDEDGNEDEDGDGNEDHGDDGGEREIRDDPSVRRSDAEDFTQEPPSSTETETETEPEPETETETEPEPETETETDPELEREREEPNASGRRDGDEDAEPTDSDRWSELGARLGTEDVESDQDRRSGTDASVGSADATDSSQDRRRTEGSESWDDRDTTVEVPGVDRTSSGGTGTPTAAGVHETELDRVTSIPSVLVLGPTGTSVSDTICSRFLTGEEGSRDVLFVTFEEPPDDRIDVCHRADEWAGGEIGIIEVGRGRRNAATSEITGGGTVGSITVRHVSNPGDLSKLGIVITQLLSKFDGTPRQTVLCFHTLSALHSQIGTKTLFRFLNTLQGRLRSSDALGHYHMDPDLHDEIVIETLRPIFDSVVRYSEDGELETE